MTAGRSRAAHAVAVAVVGCIADDSREQGRDNKAGKCVNAINNSKARSGARVRLSMSVYEYIACFLCICGFLRGWGMGVYVHVVARVCSRSS